MDGGAGAKVSGGYKCNKEFSNSNAKRYYPHHVYSYIFFSIIFIMLASLTPTIGSIKEKA